MNLDNYLLNFIQTTDDPSLDGMYYIMEKLGNPHKKLKYVHVAGTNGKGSICEMLSRILVLSDYKVGKFMTPHLITAKESISINNQHISNSEALIYIDMLNGIREEFKKDIGKEPTRFEILTSIAILHFAYSNCDIVILEVGMGGRFDCTNIIEPIVSAFGSISYDHMAVLGNTLKKIAFEKAGIIKENSNSVIFEQESLPVFEKQCTLKNNILHTISNTDISNYNFDINYQYFSYNNIPYIINLKGRKQIENTCVVLETINILKESKFNISDSNVLNGLKTVVHNARFETINQKPLLIFDGAHNENAIQNFIETVNDYYSNNTKTFIISIINTKDYKPMLDLILSAFPKSIFIFTNGVASHNYISKEELFEYASSQILNKNHNIYTEDFENIDKNLNSEVNFIIGSFYTYESAKKKFN